MSILMDNQTPQGSSENLQNNFEGEAKNKETTNNTPKVGKLKTALVALISSALMFSSCGDKSDYEEASKDFIKSEKELKKAQKELKKAQKDYQDALEEYKDAREDVKEEAAKL